MDKGRSNLTCLAQLTRLGKRLGSKVDLKHFPCFITLRFAPTPEGAVKDLILVVNLKKNPFNAAVGFFDLPFHGVNLLDGGMD